MIVTKNGKPVAVLLGISDEDEIERLTVAYSKKLRALLNAAEKRIQVAGGIPHDELWRQVDAEYADKPTPDQVRSDPIISKPQKKRRRRTSSGQ